MLVSYGDRVLRGQKACMGSMENDNGVTSSLIITMSTIIPFIIPSNPLAFSSIEMTGMVLPISQRDEEGERFISAVDGQKEILSDRELKQNGQLSVKY